MPESPVPRPPRVLAAAVLTVFGLAALRLVPPAGGWLFAPVVGAGEYSPVVALAAAGVAAAAARRRSRVAAAGAAVAAGLAAWPGVQAVRALRAAEDAVARLPAPLPSAPRGVAPGDGASVEERRVPYAAADGSPLALRLSRPRRAAAGVALGARPGLVVLYAGAWQRGDPSQSAAADRHFAARGYVVAALDYRHAPAYRHPAQLDDVRRGLALVRDSAAAWGVDPARLVLWGRSSGAHLALLAAWTPGGAGPPPRGVVGFYGPYDLAQGYMVLPDPDPLGVRAVLRAFTGGAPAERAAVYRAASPSAWVRPGLPPTLLVYAGRDHVVLPRFGRAAAAALTRARDPHVYVELPWAEHAFDLAPGGLGARVTTRVVERFLERVNP